MRKKEEGYGSAIKTCVAMGVILMIGVALTLLTGCGEKESSVTTEAPVSEIEETEPELPDMAASAIEEDDVVMTENFSLEAGAGAIGDGAATEVAEADSADVPDDAVLVDAPIDDPNELFRVSEEWAKEVGGVYVWKEGNLYSFGNSIPEQYIDQYGVGYMVYGRSKDGSGIAKLFLHDDVEVRDVIPTETREAIITSGDLSILKVSKNDEVRFFTNSSTNSLTVSKTEMVGYTIEAADHKGSDTMTYFPVVDHVLLADDGKKKTNIGVFDSNDNPVQDVRNLNYGEEYIYEYYIGTEYHEIRLPAICQCYRKPNSDTSIEIPAELTKNGYAVASLSSLEPGIYAYGSTVFELTE